MLPYVFKIFFFILINKICCLFLRKKLKNSLIVQILIKLDIQIKIIYKNFSTITI